jgi:hypothetical protein
MFAAQFARLFWRMQRIANADQTRHIKRIARFGYSHTAHSPTHRSTTNHYLVCCATPIVCGLLYGFANGLD